MLKPATRNIFAALALLFAFAAPSAVAANHSHHATSHALRHRGARHGKTVRHGKTGKARHRSKTVRLVSLRDAATTSATPLLGETAIESHTDNLNAGEAEASRVQPSTSALAGVAHVYIDSHNAARTLIVGLYGSGSSGHPGSLLTSGSIAAVQAGAWNSVALTPSSLVAGKTYWLAILGERGTLRYRDRRGGPCPSETEAQIGLGSLPGSWRTGRTYADCPLSAYVTAAESVLGPPTQVEPTPPPVVEPPMPAPTNMALPAISGTPAEGKVLSTTNGSWSGSPTSYAHQWQDCDKSGANCASVNGATGASYTLGASDDGHMMRVMVTASNQGGSSSASSAATKQVAAIVSPPPPPAPPTASFTTTPNSPVAGQPVALNGSNSTCAAAPCTYEWSDDGSPTQPETVLWPLSTGQVTSFTFQEAGTKYVRLTVTDASGQTATVEHNVIVEAESTTTPPPPPPPPAAPSNTVLPTISGTTTEGQSLSATKGSWTGSPSSYAYQWQDCDASGSNCVNIAGAKSAGVTLTSGDVGDTIRVIVTATNEGGSTAATSAATATVASLPSPPPPPAAPSNTVLPTISGTTTEGQSLSATKGSWTGSPSSYAYQWQDCDASGSNCVNIAGAKSAGVTLTSGDVGDTIRVIVTATNEGGSTAATSAATATVASLPSPPPPPAAPSNTVLPTISGTTTEGQSLSATKGSWTGSPSSYAYQWQDCDASGANCANITGAMAAGYTLAASDVNHTIRVAVTATNEGGSKAASSTQTASVAAAQQSGGGSGGGGSESCTTTISSVSQINGALKAGAVVCLTAGTYGSVSITTTPSSNATLTAAPGAHVVVGGVNIAASNVTVSQLHSTGTINVGSGGPYPGFSHDVIEHNDVGPTNGYGISVMSATSTPSSYITIAYNRIHNTSPTNEGDALRFDGWNHITVEGNDIYEIKECPGSTCHTDTLQSYNGGVTTSGLTITKNYTHDNAGAQGLPFLKDGDISNVTISDNLSLRNTNTNGQVTGIWVDENIPGLTITNNTYQGTSGSIVQADGSAAGPTVGINHNVFDNINVRPGSGPSYATTENYDVFTGNDEYTFNVGPNSLMESKPAFMNTATDDYRLAKNPNHIGIDWSPAEVLYGPAN